MGIKAEDLDKFESYMAVSEDTLLLLKEKGRSKKLKKGELVFNEKDKVNIVYFIISGKVTMFRHGEGGHNKRVVYILNEGEFINEVIFDNVPASISCEAFQDCELLYFYKEDFMEAMAKDFQLTKVIMNSMSRKIRRLYRQMKNSIPIKMDKKLAAKIWKLSKDYGVETKEGTLIDIDLSITYIASMLGSARETISKCMTKFEKEGLIKYKGKKIIVPDRNALSIYFRGIEE